MAAARGSEARVCDRGFGLRGRRRADHRGERVPRPDHCRPRLVVGGPSARACRRAGV
jgi:hypothetical protein